MLSAETGNLLLTFRDERDVELVPSHQVSQTIERGRTEKTTLSQELVIPRRVQVLFVRIPVWPEGVRNPVGALRLRYPVSPGK